MAEPTGRWPIDSSLLTLTDVDLLRDEELESLRRKMSEISTLAATALAGHMSKVRALSEIGPLAREASDNGR